MIAVGLVIITALILVLLLSKVVLGSMDINSNGPTWHDYEK